MTNALKNQISTNSPVIVHVLETLDPLDPKLLYQAIDLCQGRPVLIIAVSKTGLIEAKSCVPENMVTNKFSAEKWLEPLTSQYGAKSFAPKGQNGQLKSNMESCRYHKTSFEEDLRKSVENCIKFAKENM